MLNLHLRTLGLGNLRPITFMDVFHSDPAQNQFENGHTRPEFGTFNFQILTNLDKISNGLKPFTIKSLFYFHFCPLIYASIYFLLVLPAQISKHNSLSFPYPGTGPVTSLRNLIFRDFYRLPLNSSVALRDASCCESSCFISCLWTQLS